MFTLNKSCASTSARAGVLQTSHGLIETPVFMPIGTYAAIKTLSTDEIKKMDFNLVLSNTYHLYLRPGIEILKEFQGLHNFMNWDGAILTDSGGFQIYSLSKFKKIDDNGVEFKSHLDGSKHYFTPEKIVDIQRYIGSDIMMVLDVCPPSDATYEEHTKAVDLTTQWAKMCLNHLKNKGPKYNFEQIISPIVQGGTSEKLRKISAEQLIDLDAKMYAIGGLAVGEPKEEMLKTVEWMDEFLPKDKPRYLMGVGTPADLVESVSRGVDMFDCVMPTRNARNGQLFTFDGKINIRNAKFKTDFSPIDKNGFSPMSEIYTKAYLHQLFKTEEILGYRIATQHNLRFYIYLMNSMQKEIKNGNFKSWAKDFLAGYSNS